MATRSVVRVTSPPGFRSPASGYEAPFEMLQACHERVVGMLDLVVRLRQRLATHGCDDDVRQAAQDVIRYFDLAAPRHHEDEERHVFPALIQLADPHLDSVVQQLQQDHRKMEGAWKGVREVLDALAHAEITALSTHQARQLDSYAELYAGHMRIEEAVAYPQAYAALNSAAVVAMAGDMMRRRGVG